MSILATHAYVYINNISFGDTIRKPGNQTSKIKFDPIRNTSDPARSCLTLPDPVNRLTPAYVRKKLASNNPQIGLDLKEFRGSSEEKTVKRILKFITAENITVSPTPAFINLVIHRSNASDRTSFSDAYVSLQISYEIQEAFETDYDSGCPESKLVYMKDILNVSVLENFQTCGVDAIEKYPDVCRQSFLRLLEFLREKRNHEKAIKKLLTATTLSTNGNKETQIMAGLAHHLFSQLVPGKKYEVDEYAKQLPKECGCGCKANICSGNTSVGKINLILFIAHTLYKILVRAQRASELMPWCSVNRPSVRPPCVNFPF
ncbi:uncharacterized protein LOC117315812 [Pecten maximus]|uniref:uncharacterized protein LOC117315812 n=1 Tax=Pecten maximus TaxID=6579 RepID=UPI00145808DD|nr:uncharacterized protein LOC117315812 [Pecten maximus]